MKIPYPCKPHATAARQMGRYALNTALYTDGLKGIHDGPVIIGTNGKMLSIVPVQLDDGDGFNGQDVQIPVAAMKAACKKAEPAMTVDLAGPDPRITSAGVTMDAPSEGEYPDTSAVVRDCCPANPPGGTKVSLNVAYLKRLADAMGSDEIEITLPVARERDGLPDAIVDAMLVRPLDGPVAEEAFGLLMPISRS